MSKAIDLIPKIISAQSKKDAIEVLNETLIALHLTNSYTDLVKIKDDLEEYEVRFKVITDSYDDSSKNIEDMLNTRLSLNFLYRDTVDQFSFKINSQKIFWEERKTAVRGESLMRLRHDEKVQESFKTKSTSALRDIVGLDDGYQEYITNASLSYGLYQQLMNFLNSIRQFIDYLASAIKNEHIIQQQDAR